MQAMTAQSSWQSLFVGRERELKQLRDAWRKVAPDSQSGTKPEPQLVVLLAESGLGKTRLVQEFYRWLSTTQDYPTDDAPQGYWPDAFTSERESLDVNPSFASDESGVGSIPWLWWGIRFSRPDRRNEVGSHCGVIDYRSALSPHLTPILAARQLKVETKGAIWKTLSVLGEFVPGSGLMFGIRDVWELATRDRETSNQFREQLSLTPGTAVERERLQAEEVVLDYFRTVLDTRNRDAATVPVILFLDDAQWADPVTLRFLSRLLDESRDHSWPLLVVCTHWEREWKATLNDPLGSRDRPQRLSAVTESFRRNDDDYSIWLNVRTLSPVADLSEVIHSAFPSLTNLQMREVLEKSGGNPLLLTEILFFLERRPQFFTSRDFDQPLTPAGLQQLHQQKFDLEKLIDDRFQSLAEEVQRVLGWCSEQGQSFLMEITLASAKCVDPSITEGRLQGAISLAESPYSMIQTLGEPGRFNRREFRQAVFHKVARDYLRFQPEELACVQQAIRDTLIGWLMPDSEGDGTLLDSLPEAEQLDALIMARRSLSPDSTEPEEVRRAWSFAMVRLAFMYRDQFLWDQAWEVAETWGEAAQNGSFSEWLAPSMQVSMCEIIHSRNQHSLAAAILSPLATALERHAEKSENEGILAELSITLGHLGNVERADGNRDLAKTALVRSVNVCVRRIKQFNKTKDSLDQFSIALCNLAILHREEGNHPKATSAFKYGLKIDRTIIESFGNSPQSLRHLSVSLDGVGDSFNEMDQREDALIAYQESLEISDKLYRESGETLDSLRNLAIALARVAMFEYRQADPETALLKLHRAQEIYRRVIQEFGETPQSLRGLMVSNSHVAKVVESLGTSEQAREHVREGLSIAEKIVGDYGETPLALRDLAVMLGSVGDFEFQSKDYDPALSKYHRRLKINKRVIAVYGQTSQSLSDVARAIESIGDVELEQGLALAARATYERGLIVRDEVIAKFGESPQGLMDLSNTYIKIGNAFSRTSGAALEEVEMYFELAAQIAKDVIKDFGETPQSLWALATCYLKLGSASYVNVDHLEDARDLIQRMVKHGWATADQIAVRDDIAKRVDDWDAAARGEF
jgi:tetratricopeptide (TPR) repeat protein